jgi:hypothetical protein
MRPEFSLVFVCWIGIYAQAAAQSPQQESDRVTEVCDCLPSPSANFSNQAYAQKVVDSLSTQMGEPRFDVLSVSCTHNAQALRCGDRKYILYNNDLLERMQKRAPWAERFIMAHEIAHHALEHTSRKSVFNSTVLPSVLIDRSASDEKIFGYKVRVKKDGTVQKTIKTNNQSLIYAANYYNHFKEYQADAAATLILYQQRIPSAQLDSIWTQYSIQTHTDPLGWTAQHPSITVRRMQTLSLWHQLKAQGYPALLPTSSGESRRKAVDQLSGESVARFLSKTAQRFGPDSTTLLPPDEQLFWEYIRIRHTLVVEPDAGIMLNRRYWQPSLSEPNALKAKWDGFNGYAGVRFTRLSWYSPIWWQTSVGYKTLSFTTFDVRNNLQESIEHFRWQGLYLSPQVLITNVSGKYNFAPLRQGFYIALGGTLDVPIRFSYQNFTSGATPRSLTSQALLSPLVEVGLIQLSRDPRKINFRLGLAYQPQRIALDANSPRRVTVPQLSLRLNARMW